MNSTPHELASVGSNKILPAIVAALKEHPLYLLIFALAFLSLLLCGYSFAAGSANLQLVSTVGFLTLALAGIWVVRSIELNSLSQLENELKDRDRQIGNLDSQLKSHDKNEINLAHQGMSAHFLEALENTRKALAFPNETFLEEIESSIGTFAAGSADWSQGNLVTDAASYERILCETYQRATRTVFATSNEHYMSAWLEKDRSDKIIDAHRIAYQMNNATVTRVFVFESVSKIEQKHIAIMEQQDNLPFIKTLVLIIDENQKIKVSSYLVRDFAIIDVGELTQTIGVESAGDFSSVARWIFRRDPRIEKFAENVEFASITLDKLRSRIADQL